jgi:hypothetical protein
LVFPIKTISKRGLELVLGEGLIFDDRVCIIHNMTLALFFKKKPVATLAQLEKTSGLSGRSVLRHLKALGYYSSYTHNSRYYTLKSIPKFDKNLIWFHRDIGFTKLNSIYDVIVHCTDRSKMGYSAKELSEVVRTRVLNQLRTLVQGRRLNRGRFSNGYVYFSMDPVRYHKQVNQRRKVANEMPVLEAGSLVDTGVLPGGLSHSEIVIVLTTMLHHPRSSLKALQDALLERKLRVSKTALLEMFEAYGLEEYKKKEHRLLSLILEHIASMTGESRWKDPSKILTLHPHKKFCPQCKRRLHSYKTQRQLVYSVVYGNFTVRAKYLYCPVHAYNLQDNESVVSYRSEALAKIVGHHKRYAYDVMTYIGVSRFLQGRQIQEICAELDQDYSIPVSTSQAGRLSEEFLIRLSCLHASYRFHLKSLIDRQGGYYLHIDASYENKSSTVLVGLDGVTGWVLFSEKLPSEREEFIVPALRQLRRDFGQPQGIMRDMARSMEKAVSAVFPNVPQRVCHFHFLRDVGKDILKQDYHDFRSVMIAEKVTPQLNSLRRNLLEPLKKHKPDRQIVQDVLSGRRKISSAIYKTMDVLIVVSTIDWIMDYPQDGSGLGFPFDHSYIDYYGRCQKAYKLLLYLQERVSSPKFKDAQLDTLVFVLARILEPAYEAAGVLKQTHVNYTAKRSEFNKLRRVMRFYCDAKAPLSQDLGYRSIEEMRAANKELKKFFHGLKMRIKKSRQQARRTAMHIVIAHLEKHWKFITVQTRKKTLYGARTNNTEERFYRGVKKKFRRALGKKDISNEFDRLGTYIPLVRNLENPAYVETVIGSIENLPEAFADLDPQLVAKHTEKFYENRFGVAYELRKIIDPIKLLQTCNPQS